MKKLWTINDIKKDITYISVFTLIIWFISFFNMWLVFRFNLTSLILWDIFISAICIFFITIANDADELKRFIPLNYILKYDFEYAIDNKKSTVNVYRLILDDQKIKASDSRNIVKISELVKSAKNVSIVINNFTEVKVKKEEILSFLEKQDPEKKLNQIKLMIPISVKIYLIRSSFLPNDYLKFYTYEDNDTLQKINKIPKKILLKTIINWFKNDDSMCQHYLSKKSWVDYCDESSNKYVWKKLK